MDPGQAGVVQFVWRDPPAEAANLTVTWTVSWDSLDWTMLARPADASDAAATEDAGDDR